MKEKQDYIRDITEIRSMMERSSKFLALSGWAGIMAGIFGLAGASIAYKVLQFNPDRIAYPSGETGALAADLMKVVLVGSVILILALATAVYFSYKRAEARGEKLWNATSKQLLVNSIVPFIVGAALVLILISHNLIGLLAPVSLIFYGLALFNASKYTYDAVKVLGVVEMVLGLISAYFVASGLLCWTLGFGVAHIIYGIYVYYRYER